MFVWSIGNELTSQARPGPGRLHQAARRTTAQASTRRGRSAMAIAGYPPAGCQRRYAPLDVIGVNDYFGWYPGPGGQIVDRTQLSAYLDKVRACYPQQGDLVTEFGAEANRAGAGRGEGHVRVPAGLRQLPPRRLRHEAVAERRDLLRAAGVPGAARAGTAATRARTRRCTRRAWCTYDGVAQARVLRRAAVHRRASSSSAGDSRPRHPASDAGAGGPGPPAPPARRRSRPRPQIAQSLGTAQARTGAGSASGSGMPPEGDTFGLVADAIAPATAAALVLVAARPRALARVRAQEQREQEDAQRERHQMKARRR